MKPIRIAAPLVALLLSGCAVTAYHEPKGPWFIRITLLTTQSVGKVEVKTPDKSLIIDGHKSDQTEGAAAIAGAAVQALKPSILP